MNKDNNSEIKSIGSCNCGKVKFELLQALTDVFVCHCSICRKATGSGGIAVTIVPNTLFRVVSGSDAVRQWTKPNHDWLCNFCQYCGSPLPGKNDELHTYVPVSLLDSGYEELQVKHHLFVDSKAPWEYIAGPGKQHLQAFQPWF